MLTSVLSGIRCDGPALLSQITPLQSQLLTGGFIHKYYDVTSTSVKAQLFFNAGLKPQSEHLGESSLKISQCQINIY